MQHRTSSVANDDEEAAKVRIMVFSDFDFAMELTPKYASTDDGHAGTLETSRVMAINPELVKAKGEAGVWHMPRFEVVAHPELCFPSGVNGDPTAASAEKGRQINQYISRASGEISEKPRSGLTKNREYAGYVWFFLFLGFLGSL